MFRHILVPLDGSGLAEAALPAAAFIAERMGARVTLLHVLEKAPPEEVHGQPHLRDEAGASAYLAEVAGRAFPPEVRVDVHVHGTPAGDVARSIVEHAAEFDHDLIVLCSHGRGRALNLVLGSIAQKVASMGTLPVLLVYPGDSGEAPSFVCEKILLPLDDDPEHDPIRPMAVDLAKSCGASIHLVMAVPRFFDLAGRRAVTSRFLPGATSRLLEFSADEARERLQQELEALREQGITATGQVYRGDPSQVIIEAAREAGADLVALATHGATGLAALIEGSVAHKVCSLCGLPILMVQAGEGEGASRPA